MNKWIKYVFALIGVIILAIILDLICIFTLHRPLFAQGEDYGTHAIYKGIFYNTYNCAEYSTPQIKAKWTKFTCAVDRIDIGDVVEIVDTSENKLNFACAEALESFYEDEKYTYYWNCMKNEYMIVKYKSGFEETVKNALNYGTITIDDLDTYNIEYSKYEK